MEQFVGSVIREGQPTHAKPKLMYWTTKSYAGWMSTHTMEIVHQPTTGYTDLSTDSFKKRLEFGKGILYIEYNGGFCPGGFVQGDFVLGGILSGGFCPRTLFYNTMLTHALQTFKSLRLKRRALFSFKSCPNSLKELTNCGVISVRRNQRKWLVEQCFQMLLTTTVQNFRSFGL